jgi:sporulation protein YlmC with PRC-barrel domain
MGSLEARSLPKATACSLVTASLVGADDMLGAEVIDCDGVHIGELQDVMLDLRAARVAYGLVALDRPPEWSERLVAVPWNVMQIDGKGELRVNAPRDWVERAPAAQSELTPMLLDHEWAVFIHSYFGAKPYWEPNAQHA